MRTLTLRICATVAVLAALLATLLPQRPVAAGPALAACDSATTGLLSATKTFFGAALGLDLQGSLAYVGDWGSAKMAPIGAGSLHIFDLADPCAPQLLGRAETTTPGNNELADLVVHNGVAYLANDANGLARYNVADPAHPAALTGHSTGYGTGGPYAHSIFYDGGQYAYVGRSYSAGSELAIYDMSAFPAAAPTFYAPTFSGHRDIYDVQVVDQRAYVMASDGSGTNHFQILDVTTPTAPSLLGDLAVPQAQYGGVNGEMRVQGNYVYLATSTQTNHNGGLVVLNVVNPASPQVAGSLFLADAGSIPWKGTGLDINGNQALLVGKSALYSIDISNPAQLAIKLQLPLPTEFGPALGGKVMLKDDLAYVTVYGDPNNASSHGGLAIYRLSQPPTVSAPATITIPENDTRTLGLLLGDADTSINQLTVTVSSSNTALIPDSGLTLSGSGGKRDLTITPAPTDAAQGVASRQGTATVTVTVSDGTQSATAQIAVTVAPPTWLAMLYLAGDNNLDEAVDDILSELRRMPYNPAVRIVVLSDQSQTGDSQIYVREPGNLVRVGAALLGPNQEIDSGSPNTISDFILWATGTYTTSYTMLALMDHGGGWAPDLELGIPQPATGGSAKSGGWRGMSLDMSAGGGSTLSTLETRLALQGTAPIDVLLFDACLMGMIENAYEMRDQAAYLIAAENLLYQEKDILSYSDYLGAGQLSADTIPEDLARSIVSRYNSYASDGYHVSSGLNPFSIAAIKLQGTAALSTTVDTLAQKLLSWQASQGMSDAQLYTALRPAYDAAQKFDYDSDLKLEATEGYVDLGHFAALLQADTALPADVRTAAGAVVAQVAATVTLSRTVSGSYIAGANAPIWDLNQARGLSIYLPLGEQDWRPTAIPQTGAQLPQGCEVASEDQTLYYLQERQLRFVRDSPAWANLIARIYPQAPIIHAPCLPQSGVAALAGSQTLDTSPFHTPGRLDLIRQIYIYMPLISR